MTTKSNAVIFSEALNVFHNTGLTPRELQEQRDKLYTSLRECHRLMQVVWGYDGDVFGAHVAQVAGGELADMAREVLKTDEIEFSRWCA